MKRRPPRTIPTTTAVCFWCCLTLQCRYFFPGSFVLALSLSPNNNHQGSAATPTVKRVVAVAGAGGVLGGGVVGFLQRAGSLYETGLSNRPHLICATADTAVLLNRLLSKQFCLAFADESYFKLTNLQSVEAIRQRLEACDALILGTTMSVRRRSVVSGTYETSPNDKAWEIYWDEGSSFTTDDDDGTIAKDILDRFLQAAKECRRLQHLIVVDRDGSIVPQLLETNIPFTCIVCPSQLINAKDYTFQKGVQTQLSIKSLTDSTDDQTVPSTLPVYRQDLAALICQILQTLSWNSSRVLLVSAAATGYGTNTNNDSRPSWSPSPIPKKRVDQEWCVNSHVLREQLQPFLEDASTITMPGLGGGGGGGGLR